MKSHTSEFNTSRSIRVAPTKNSISPDVDTKGISIVISDNLAMENKSKLLGIILTPDQARKFADDVLEVTRDTHNNTIQNCLQCLLSIAETFIEWDESHEGDVDTLIRIGEILHSARIVVPK